MSKSELSLIQQEISKALIQLQNKSLITEAVIAKKIRENTSFSGKSKAGLALNDIETSLTNLEETEKLYFSVHCNSANDLFLKKEDSSKSLDDSFRQRRLKSEKSITLLTSGDFKLSRSDKSNKKSQKPKKRTERKSLYVYDDFDD